MIPLIFLMLFCAILAAFFDARRYSLIFFIVSYILSTFWFMHHTTQTIGLSL
ncbi:MAG: hypothetical protein H0W64_02800 [Gammaproteobacteria bacterium]|nr:hypothetical protein [Gammaproteobacteria bacterium]